jgi:hypothetical protein
MGLSGVQADLDRNVSLLIKRPWLDIALQFRDGSRSLLAIEKGDSGQRAISAALERPPKSAR